MLEPLIKNCFDADACTVIIKVDKVRRICKRNSRTFGKKIIIFYLRSYKADFDVFKRCLNIQLTFVCSNCL